MPITRLGITTLRLPRPPVPDLQDPEAIAAVHAGDRSAFATLLHRHAQTVFRACRAVLGSERYADVASHAAWVDVFLAFASAPVGGPFRPWVVRVAIETASRLRKQNMMESPLEHVTKLERELDELPDAMRTVLVLRDIIGLDAAETGKCLDIEEENVGARLTRARQVLARRLPDLGEITRSVAVDVWRFEGDRLERVLTGVMTKVNELR